MPPTTEKPLLLRCAEYLIMECVTLGNADIRMEVGGFVVKKDSKKLDLDILVTDHDVILDGENVRIGDFEITVRRTKAPTRH